MKKEIAWRTLLKYKAKLEAILKIYPPTRWKKAQRHQQISRDIWFTQTESGGHTQFKKINFKQWNSRWHQKPTNQEKPRTGQILSWVLQDLQRRTYTVTPQRIPWNRKGGNSSKLNLGS